MARQSSPPPSHLCQCQEVGLGLGGAGASIPALCPTAPLPTSLSLWLAHFQTSGTNSPLASSWLSDLAHTESGHSQMETCTQTHALVPMPWFCLPLSVLHDLCCSPQNAHLEPCSCSRSVPGDAGQWCAVPGHTQLLISVMP